MGKGTQSARNAPATTRFTAADIVFSIRPRILHTAVLVVVDPVAEAVGIPSSIAVKFGCIPRVGGVGAIAREPRSGVGAIARGPGSGEIVVIEAEGAGI